MYEADEVFALVPSWGGTGLLRKGPIRRAVRVVAAALGIPAQPDFAYWAPPGPGARTTLDLLRVPCGHHARSDKPSDKYAKLNSPQGQAYVEEMNDLHAFMREHPQLETLEAISGRSWELHNTQAGACYYSRYYAIRSALLGEGPWPSHMRMYTGSRQSPKL